MAPEVETEGMAAFKQYGHEFRDATIQKEGRKITLAVEGKTWDVTKAIPKSSPLGGIVKGEVQSVKFVGDPEKGHIIIVVVNPPKPITHCYFIMCYLPRPDDLAHIDDLARLELISRFQKEKVITDRLANTLKENVQRFH